jgi:hypothetical protein
MNRRMILGGVCVAAGGLIVVGLRATSTEVAPPVRQVAAPKSTGPTQQILQRLDVVERALRERDAVTSSERLAEPARVNHPPPEPEEATGVLDVPAPSREQLLALEREATARFYDELEIRFEEQSSDPHWSVDTERALRDAMRTGDSIPVTAESIECRSNSCRSVLSHEARRPAMEFLNAMVDATASQLNHTFQYEDGRTVIYSFRQRRAEAARQ